MPSQDLSRPRVAIRRRTAGVCASVLAALGVSAGVAGAAEAAEIHAKFDHVVTSMGTMTDRELLVPGDPQATLDGEFNPADNTFTIPVSGYNFPPSRAFEATPGSTVKLEFAANGPVTGTYDPGTGAMSANLDTRLTVTLGGTLPAGSCTIPSVKLVLSTAGRYGTPPAEPEKAGAPFAPPSNAGALVASWTSLPPATEGDPTCAGLVSAVAGTSPGGIRMAGSVSLAGLPGGSGAGVTGQGSQGGGASSGGPNARRQLKALSVRVTSRAKRLPYRYTISGKLSLPSGVRPADGCQGTVHVQIKTGSQTISSRRVRVRSDCTYRSGVAFRMRSRLGRSGKLRAIVRFNGNQVVLPKRRAPRTLRFG